MTSFELYYVLEKDSVTYVVNVPKISTKVGQQWQLYAYGEPVVLGTIAKEDLPEHYGYASFGRNFARAVCRPGDKPRADKIQPLDDVARDALTTQLTEVFQQKAQPEVRQIYGLPA